jgi:hypothetical protein
MVAQIWYSMRSYSAITRHQRQRRNRHLTRSCKTLMAAQIWHSIHSCHGRRTPPASTSGPTSHTLLQNVNGPCKCGVRHILIPAVAQHQRQRQDRHLTHSRETSNGRANLALDRFPIPPSHSIARQRQDRHLSHTLSQNVNGLCDLLLDVFFSRRRPNNQRQCRDRHLTRSCKTLMAA